MQSPPINAPVPNMAQSPPNNLLQPPVANNVRPPSPGQRGMTFPPHRMPSPILSPPSSPTPPGPAFPMPLLAVPPNDNGASASRPLRAQTHPIPSRPSSALSEKPGEAAAEGKKLCEGLVYAEGEIPILYNYGSHIRSGDITIKNYGVGKWYKPFGSDTSWTDAHGTLLDNYFLLLKEEEKSSSGATRHSHLQRPIPLECLRLASFNDGPETRKPDLPLSKQITSCLTCCCTCCCDCSASTEPLNMYPFTIYHAAAKITRRYTLYTKTATERNWWRSELDKAIDARKSQQDSKSLYTPQTLNDGFFRIPPRIQFTRGVNYTGRIACAALFSFGGEGYIAVGCTSGIYVSKRATDHSFRKVLESNEPNSMVAIPEFNKFLVHCESTLSSYALDNIVRVSQDATSKCLEEPETKLAKDDGAVSFLKVGRINNRTFVIYAAKTPTDIESQVLELKLQVGDPPRPANSEEQYEKLGSPIITQEIPHDATFFSDEKGVAICICTPKAIHIAKLGAASGSSPTVVPEYAKPKPVKNRFVRTVTKGTGKVKKLLTRKKITPKILELVGKANILGMVTYEDDILLVYNDFGYFVNKDGKAARSSYYIEWERRATAYARRGSHLLLFSPGYIEIRRVDSGKLFWMMEIGDMRLLRSGLTEWAMLLGAMTGGAQDDGGRTEKLVELVYREPGPFHAQAT